ncbi:MAG: FtsL-like putative cell division protein [Bacteroidota bacterium]
MSTKRTKRQGLSSRKVDDYLRFSLFLVVIGLFYIWNSYQAEKQVKLMEAYRVSVKDLKSRYLLKQSTLHADMRFAEVREQVDTLGLRPLYEPAYKIVRGVEMPLKRLEPAERNPEQRFDASLSESMVAMTVPDSLSLE